MNRNHFTFAVLLTIITLTIGGAVIAAPGDRSAPLDAYMRTLNGKPVRMGNLVMTGSSITNATTSTAFTLNDGKALVTVCDGSAVCNVGASGCSVSSTYTNAAMGIPLDAKEKWYATLAPNEACIACIGTAGINCVVHELR